MKIKKKLFGGSVRGVGGCENSKKNGGGVLGGSGWGGVRVDVNEELKFL